MLQRLRNLWSQLRAHPRRRMYGVTFGITFCLVAFAACSSTNTYPIDYFSEMHYEENYRTVEPPRFGAPENAIPVQGHAPFYDRQQLIEVENPVEADEESVARGQRLFQVNCVACHGTGGQGDGQVAIYFQNAGVNPPANLTQERLVNQSDGYIYSVLYYGLGNMPSFGNLVQGQDIWDIVNYVRGLQGQTGQ